jgi:mono/diheme cytochrome c family protein
MKPCIAVSILVAALLSVVACNQPGNTNVNRASTSTPAPVATATPDELGFARANYAKHCTDCHGAEGNGGMAEVEGKRIKVPSLKEGHALKHTDDDFVEQINEGEEEMPAFKDKLSPDEISMLVKFIRVEFQGRQ